MRPAAKRLLLLTFIESFATILIERGIYFFSENRLHFTARQNLWLALVFGVTYVAGSLLSHPVARRVGEKRLLRGMLLGQVALLGVLAVWMSPAMLFACQVLLGFAYGCKWPIVESYVSANQTPKQVARTLGWFNLSWSSAVPLSLAASGLLIAFHETALFLAAASATLVGLLLMVPLGARVVHMPHDHPDRPAAPVLTRLRHLLRASRMLMVWSYAAMWILAALVPEVFKALGFATAVGACLAAGLDAVRTASFAGLRFWTAWHWRRWPLVVAMIALPAGFFMVLSGPNLAIVLCGEVVFGLAAGMVYYASLYYAMVVKNAAVEAGGGHEGLIGLGFALGPACGLLGMVLTGGTGQEGLATVAGIRGIGTLAGAAPIFLVCTAVAVAAMRRAGPLQKTKPL